MYCMTKEPFRDELEFTTESDQSTKVGKLKAVLKVWLLSLSVASCQSLIVDNATFVYEVFHGPWTFSFFFTDCV